MYNFDNSMMTGCNTSYVIKHVLNLSAKNKIPWAELGSAVHVVLEHHFSGVSIGDCMSILSDEYDKIFPPGTIPEKKEMYAANVFDIVEEYLENHPLESFPFEVIELEKTIGVQLSPEYTYWMKRDMFVRDKITGRYCCLDHKTRWSRINEYWSAKFKRSSQLTGYIWGNKLYCEQKGLPASSNIYINAIQFAELPTSTNRCKTHRTTYDKCRKLHAYSTLMTFSRSEAEIENWKNAMFNRAVERNSMGNIYDSVEKLQAIGCDGVFNDEATKICNYCSWAKTGFDKEIMDNFVEPTAPWEPWNDENAELLRIY